jgi:hypothetical protein
MPRRTYRQLVGKQEDTERQEREEELHALEWELRVAWAIRDEKSASDEVELAEPSVSQHQAKISLLTVP